MKYNNSIRVTGSKEFVARTGDLIISTLGPFEVVDSGVRVSSNPKYRGNYIRYITLK